MRISNSSETRFLEFYGRSLLYPKPVVFWPSTQSILFATNENTFTEWMSITNVGKIGKEKEKTNKGKYMNSSEFGQSKAKEIGRSE